ncbi:MAG: FAD/NAD(P)-binding protein [Elusimicrobiota bacterium]
MKNIYKPVEATIENIIDETSTIKTFTVRPKEQIVFQTGQFVQLTLPGVGECPFTPSSSPLVKDTMDVTIVSVGKVTEKLHKAKKTDKVGVRGPYGKGYPIESFYNKEVLIVGGGVGMAPLRSFLLTLLAQKEKFKRIILCYGSRTPEDMVYKYLFPQWQKTSGLEVLLSVDKCTDATKWSGEVGVVTCLLDKVSVDVKNSIAVVCGPPIMMKFTTLKLIEKEHRPENIYLSMERNMSCGVGKCGHCGIGPYFVCKDGPVFTYETLKNEPDIWA